MQEMGLEPTRYCYHRHLKPARLPIPPLLQNPVSQTRHRMIFYIILCAKSRCNSGIILIHPDPYQDAIRELTLVLLNDGCATHTTTDAKGSETGLNVVSLLHLVKKGNKDTST